MSTDLLRSALEEERRLVEHLRGSAEFRQLEAVRAVISAYQGMSALSGQARPAAVVVGSHVVQSEMGRRGERSGSRSTLVSKMVIDHLRDTGRRAQSQEIMRFLASRGITFSGDKPSAALSSILSHNPAFDNVRGEGYGLAEWQTRPPLPGTNPEPGHASASADEPVAGVNSNQQLEEMLQ